jgi:uncharacterized membrane protein YedE/YeeE
MPLWPWWLGAIGFAAVAVLHLVVLRRPLGVSGLLRTAISPTRRREERDADDIDDDDLQRALEEATRRAFAGTPLPVVTDSHATTAVAPAPLPWSRAVLFLGGIGVGGALAALLQGDGTIEVLPHGLYQRVFGGNGGGVVSVVGPVVALTVGGVLVGFGTAMGGGCTSGHGLVGVARLQVPSLVATACFFGVGIVLSLLMKAAGLGGL